MAQLADGWDNTTPGLTVGFTVDATDQHKATSTSAYGGLFGFDKKWTGKLYFEITIQNNGTATDTQLGMQENDTGHYVVYRQNGATDGTNTGSVTTGNPTFGNGDVIGLAVDFNTHTMRIGVNGTPNLADTGVVFESDDNFVVVATTDVAGVVLILNLGLSAFTSAMPAGYSTWYPTAVDVDSSVYLHNISDGIANGFKSVSGLHPISHGIVG